MRKGFLFYFTFLKFECTLRNLKEERGDLPEGG